MSNILDRIYRGIKKFRPDLNDQDAMRYAYTIVDASAESNVDPISITAQIAQESSFNPQAVSRTGPKGLAQLNSRMAKHYGVSDPFDPVQSIYAMAEAMQDNLKKNKRDKIGDSWELAQMRYSEGGPRMKSMLKSGDLTQQAKTYSSQIEKRKKQMFEDTTPYEFTYSGGDLPEITVKPDMMKMGGKIKKYQTGGNVDPENPKKVKPAKYMDFWGAELSPPAGSRQEAAMKIAYEDAKRYGSTPEEVSKAINMNISQYSLQKARLLAETPNKVENWEGRVSDFNAGKGDINPYMAKAAALQRLAKESNVDYYGVETTPFDLSKRPARINKITNTPKYQGGGVIDPLVQANPYMAAAGIGIDLIRTAVENSRRPADTRNLNENVNPYGFMANGGRINIEGGETITDAERGSNIFIAKGPRHEQGGIDMKASGGVVKSDRIGYDKDGYITTNPKSVKKTFADVDKKISNQLKDRFDPISKKTKELVIQKTERDNVAVTEAENQFKYGGKMKYALGGGLPGFMGIPGLENYIQGDQMFNPDFDPRTISDSSTPINFADPQMWGDSRPEAYTLDMAKRPTPRKPLSPMDGEQMSKFGALAGGTYSMIEGLINRPEKERARTLSTQFRGNYYNPTTERQANQAALTTALRGQNYMGSGIDNANRIAALSGYQQNEGNIARSKFNYDSQVDQRRSMFNLQRDQFNTQSLAATDVMNAQNRAQGRNLRRQGVGNQLQSIANVGDYSNRQMEQKLKIGLLKDLFTNYGLEANTIQELSAAIAKGDYYKNPDKNGG